MTRTEEAGNESDTLPTFELEYSYDDPEDPDEVTIFDTRTDDLTTTWITIEIDQAVRLDRIA